MIIDKSPRALIEALIEALITMLLTIAVCATAYYIFGAAAMPYIAALMAGLAKTMVTRLDQPEPKKVEIWIDETTDHKPTTEA